MTIREQVDDYMRAARIPRADLAERVGCSRQSLSRLLVAEAKNPSVTPLLLQVLDALGLFLTITKEEPERVSTPTPWFDERRGKRQ